MIHLRKMEQGANLVGYASSLAHELFQGVVRQSGLPYTQEHLAEVARLVAEITLPSAYQDAAIAAAWLHDAAEDIPGIDVFDPFARQPRRKASVIYINDLLAGAGEAGAAAAYMVHALTHREGTPYQVYAFRIFEFPDGGEERKLKILAGIGKMADRRKNLDPRGARDIDSLVDEYLSMKRRGAAMREFEAFYQRTKTIDAFRQQGLMGYDVGLFSETLRRGFHLKQQANAINNLTLYLPLAEHRLLVDVGENSGLFRWDRLRQMLKETFRDSLALSGIDIHVVSSLGLHQGAAYPPGYTPLRTEVRKELLAYSPSTARHSPAP